MATITGLTAAAMIAIRDSVIVDAHITADHLILVKYDDTEIDVGVVKGDTGDTGPTGATSIVVVDDEASRPTGVDLFDGLGIWQKDVEALFLYNEDTTEWLMPHAGIPHSHTAREPVNTTACTDADYSPFATPLKLTSFYKKREDSHLIVTYEGAIRNDNPWGEYRVGVNVIGETDPLVNDYYDLVDGFGDLGPKSCSREIVSNTYPKGLYTFEAVRRLVNGVGVVYDGQHNNNRNSLTVVETF